MSDKSSKVFLPGAEYGQMNETAPTALGPLTALQGIMDVTPIGGASLTAARSAGVMTDPVGFDAQPDDIVEIQLENGLRLWQTVDSAQADYATASRAPNEQAFLIPTNLDLRAPGAGTSRGLSDYAVKGVSILRGFFTDKTAEKAGEMAAFQIAKHIESSLTLGLHRCVRPSDLDAKGFDLTKATLVKADEIPTNAPVLILLHGTFSSTSGSFSELLNDPQDAKGKPLWERLEDAFPGGIFAFEHRSVTDSPIRNAMDLVRNLPKKAQISMMSHSRGGLIAELVARASRADVETAGAFDDDDYKIMRKTGKHEDQRDELIALRRLLKDRAPKVDQVVRVAGPVGGTTLASNRLDRFMSIILNTFDLIPALRASMAYDLFQSFMVGLVKSKANPEELPGLEAMHPLGPLVKVLNRPELKLTSRLSVIAGDNEGTGVLRKLAEMAADFFFEDENDFVVNYKSMLRGMPRAVAPIKTRIDTENITHFTYFKNEQARMNIVASLRPGSEPMLAQFDKDPVDIWDAEPTAFPEFTSRGDDTQPVCFFLHGVMGSHIYQDDDWIWVNPLRMATGGFDRLSVDAKKVEPGPMLNIFYGDLAKFIARSHRVIAFSYDWRISIIDIAAKLAKSVERELQTPNRPIRFMAHSMGGLVVRALQHTRPDLWTQIKARKGSRVVMLGTPNGGAVSMFNTMLGRTKQLKMMAAADMTNDLTELLTIVTGLPGLMQLLPSDENGAYLRDSYWRQLQSHDAGDWVIPSKAAFDAGRAGHKLLAEHQLDPETTCYVAGLGEDATPSMVRLVPDGEGGKKIEVRGTFEGDGTVTWATGIPKGINHWYMRANHGDMVRTKSAFPALLELLEDGTTSALSRTPLTVARGVGGTDVPVPEPIVHTYPDAEELQAAVMGASTRAPDMATVPTSHVQVSVAHGDLRFANYPVAVGHYAGDPISGAESALDRCLDNHLSRVRDLGLYPGPLDTCEVILRKQRCPEGAIVIGLGTFGGLKPGELRDSMRQGVLRYAMMLRRRDEEKGLAHKDMDPIGLSTLVIGNRGASMSVHQSVEAILEAVVDANKLLGDTPIAHLQFVELFEDTAFSAADALDRIARNGRVKHSFTHARQIDSIMGARLRAGFGASMDTWQRMRITRNQDDIHAKDSLNFEAIGDGAKIETENVAIQPAVMKELLKRSGANTSMDRELGRLLFELLVPTRLKNFAKDDQKLLLNLDIHTASYPWELMEDDFSAYEHMSAEGGPELDEIKPLVVRTPVIRQLVVGGAHTPRAASDTALVIGDPPSSLPPLPGAQAEAKLVADLMRDDMHYQTTLLNPPPDGIAALRTIIRNPTKILHLAAHGDLGDPATGALPGMILGGGLKLTAFEIGQMRYVPELVFLNCCHLGHIAPDVGVIAANLAQKFIEKGARAVIAAGWAVDDAAAQCFAREFYSSMKNGNSFGDAVHHARIEVYAKHPRTNTWGAYQCYGDQDYRLKAASSGGASSVEMARYFSPAHATKAAINIAHDAGTSTTGRDRLLAKLDQIEDNAEDSWRKNADWCEAMGRAYAKLDVFDRAIDLLQAAVSQPSGNASLGVLELIHNLKVREALYVWARAKDDPAAKPNPKIQAAKAVERAVEKCVEILGELDRLTAGTSDTPLRTPEREGLKGSAFKRLVLIKDGKERDIYLREMTAAYESAMQLTRAKNPARLDAYSTFNWLCGHVVMGETMAHGQPIDVWFARLVQQAQADERKRPDFWNIIHEAEIDILRPLTGPLRDPIATINTNALFESIRTNVSFAWERGGSYRQARSMREQMHFLSNTMSKAHRDKRDWITRIETFLQELTWDYKDK